MSDLPKHLASGTVLSAHWLNRLLDYLRSRDLQPGPGLAMERTPTGTVLRLAGSASRAGGGAAAGTVPNAAYPCQIAEAVADGRVGPAKCEAYRLGAGGEVGKFDSRLFCMSAAETGGLPSHVWVVGWGGALSAFAAVIPDDLEEDA